jgi:hypothetical protein
LALIGAFLLLGVIGALFLPDSDPGRDGPTQEEPTPESRRQAERAARLKLIELDTFEDCMRSSAAALTGGGNVQSLAGGTPAAPNGDSRNRLSALYRAATLGGSEVYFDSDRGPYLQLYAFRSPREAKRMKAVARRAVSKDKPFSDFREFARPAYRSFRVVHNVILVMLGPSEPALEQRYPVMECMRRSRAGTGYEPPAPPFPWEDPPSPDPTLSPPPRRAPR